MRTVDLEKHERIVSAATRLFGSRRFDEVRLEDVAAEAGVAKGTIYLHYKSKDELYLSLLYEGFSRLVEKLTQRTLWDEDRAETRLAEIVGELVRFSFAHPYFFELARRVGVPSGEPKWDRKREELFGVIEREVRRGISRGELSDPHPELTARYIPSLIRAAMLFPTGALTPRRLTTHILRLLMHGLAA